MQFYQKFFFGGERGEKNHQITIERTILWLLIFLSCYYCYVTVLFFCCCIVLFPVFWCSPNTRRLVFHGTFQLYNSSLFSGLNLIFFVVGVWIANLANIWHNLVTNTKKKHNIRFRWCWCVCVGCEWRQTIGWMETMKKKKKK